MTCVRGSCVWLLQRIFLFLARRFYSTVQIQIWAAEGPLASFCLSAASHTGLFPSAYVRTFRGWRIIEIYPRESCLELYWIFYLSPVDRRMQVSEPSEFFPPSQLKICIFAFRKDPACSLPTSARFWRDNFLFLTATSNAAAAAATERRIYFTRVVVRVFTKIATIRVWIIYKFTDFIISDKYFCEVLFEPTLVPGSSMLPAMKKPPAN